MAFESHTYTGICKYRDIDFTFVFDGDELRLIPPVDKKETIRMYWIMTPLAKGVYTMGDPLTMDEPYLTGHCNETGNDFIFITKQGGHIGSQNSVLFVPIVAYLRCKYKRDRVARMSFTSPVINCIHPVTQGFGFSMDIENFNATGVFSVTTQSFEETTTSPKTFTIDDQQVSVKFSISRKLSTKLHDSPITLSSSMLFEFEPTTIALYTGFGILQSSSSSISVTVIMFSFPKWHCRRLQKTENMRNLQLYMCLAKLAMMKPKH